MSRQKEFYFNERQQQQPSTTERWGEIIGYYLNDIGREDLLSAEEERMLGLAVHNKTPDAQSAREKLIKRNTRLVISVAQKLFFIYGINPYQHKQLFGDAIQEGNIGLMIAVDRFNPDYNPEKPIRLSTYAVPWIRQQIIRYVLSKNSTIHIPAKKLDFFISVKKAAREVQEQLHLDSWKKVSVSEIAKKMQITDPKTQELIKDLILLDLDPEQLDGELESKNGKTTPNETNEDPSIPPVDEEVVQVLLKECIAKTLWQLNPREQRVITLRFGLGETGKHSYEEIG